MPADWPQLLRRPQSASISFNDVAFSADLLLAAAGGPFVVAVGGRAASAYPPIHPVANARRHVGRVDAGIYGLLPGPPVSGAARAPVDAGLDSHRHLPLALAGPAC